ncbi:hypothetical protein GCM10009609_31940 [Pseudonocardia aurantiaca]
MGGRRRRSAPAAEGVPARVPGRVWVITKQQAADNHETIVAVADGLFRDRGVDAVASTN